MLKIIYCILLLGLRSTAAVRFSKNEVHLFFYAWYGAPVDGDGEWKHWDHEVLPHWEKRINEDFPTVGTHHEPPQKIHSPYYPSRNPYSSNDREVLRQQFVEMHDAGGTVAVVSWWGQAGKPYSTDTQHVCSDLIIRDILEAADEQSDIKIAFHLEPYHSRDIESIYDDIKYIMDNYGHHMSLYRNENNLPLFYVYDSYHIFPSQWSRLLQPDGDLSIRNTKYDGVFLGLWLEHYHGRDLFQGGFDGFYTYFATDGFSYGSTSTNWPSMCSFARKHDMICGLSVGPGYDDTSIRPWNEHNKRSRRDGEYFEKMWEAALSAKPSYISITSYNEWGEGTQIESARKVSPAENMGKDYLDYGDRGPFKYIHIAAEYASVFLPQQETLSSSVIELREGQEVEESEEATAEEVMREDGEAEENTVQVEEEGDSKASGIIGASSDGKDDASDTRESGSFSPLDDNNNGEGSDVGVDSPEDDVARSNNEL